MAFTYNPVTGLAYSDVADFDGWAREMATAKEAWLDVWMKKLLPDSVYKAAWASKGLRDKKAKRSAEFATSYLRQNGYVLHYRPDILEHRLVKAGKVVSIFRVCLQPPDPRRCRFCNQPVEPSMSLEHGLCGNCDLEQRMANRFKQAGYNAQDVQDGRKGLDDVR